MPFTALSAPGRFLLALSPRRPFATAKSFQIQQEPRNRFGYIRLLNLFTIKEHPQVKGQ